MATRNKQLTGTVVRVVVDRGFGFIALSGGGENVFFHVRDVDPELGFDETLLERHVKFETITTEKGQRALYVRAVD